MKKFQVLISATAIVVLTAVPVLAQFATDRIGNETALQMAERVDACDGSKIVDASFVENDTQSITMTKYNPEVQLRVTCVAGMAGGLGSGGAIALGIGAIALIAVLASDSNSTSSTN